MDTTETRLATEASDDYLPVLDDLRTSLTAALGGGLFWLPRQQTSLTTTSPLDRTRVIRVGPDFARGAYPPSFDLGRLTSEVNSVLARHGFVEVPQMDGSESGHVHCTSTNYRRATLQVWLKDCVEFWVDVPLPRQPSQH